MDERVNGYENDETIKWQNEKWRNDKFRSLTEKTLHGKLDFRYVSGRRTERKDDCRRKSPMKERVPTKDCYRESPVGERERERAWGRWLRRGVAKQGLLSGCDRSACYSGRV